MAYATKYDQVQRELAEEKAAERKIQRRSFVDSIIVLLILAGIVFLIHMPGINPPMPDANGGMDIILGNDLVGMNDTKESVMAGAPQNQAQPVKSEPVPQQQEPQPTIPESKDPDDVAVKREKVTKPITKPVTEAPKTTKVVTTPTVPERKADPNMGFKPSDKAGHGGTGGTGTSKGNGYVPGDQGGKDGTKDGAWEKYGNGNEGTGAGAHLAGRGKRSLPLPDCNVQVEGKDIVQIVVDKDGNVIEAHGGYRGSGITDGNTIACDEIAAKKAKFTANTDAPERQVGTIVYIHKLH